MGLNLRIENLPQLPDGGPLTYALTGQRGADIGRDAHLDWTLPDPSRHVSGKHCEIRYQDGSYLLYDVSRNGTFLNGGDRRMQSPHRLRTGDRLLIGHYIVGIEVVGEAAAAPQIEAGPTPSDPEDVWGGSVDAAPPLDPRELRPAAQMRPVRPDFLEWAVDVPNAPGSGFVARPVALEAAEAANPGRPVDWDAGRLPAPPPPEPPPAVPTPRRSIWIGAGPDGPWSGSGEAAEQQPPTPRTPAPPPVSAPPPRMSAPAQHDGPDAAGLIDRIAQGAGLPPDAFARRQAGDIAEWLGRLLFLVTDNLKQLLDARSQTKRIVRSSNQTMIAALDNNPLKFSPSVADALRIMVGPQTRSYLGAEQALQQAFDDLKSHQVRTFSAMQRALAMLIEDMDPKSIQDSLGPDKGVSGLIGSRGARLWALYEVRWQAKTSRNERGMQDLFMQYFAECYDQTSGPGGESGGPNRSR